MPNEISYEFATALSRWNEVLSTRGQILGFGDRRIAYRKMTAKRWSISQEQAQIVVMARALRLESEDGTYHVINRGNYRAPLFRTEKTKLAFLNCLEEACAKTGWRLHAWCLMSNHYHLALSTPRANLAAGMRWLQGTFALRFNRFRGERGHLFQGRYKSLAVEAGEGLGAVCHYIHLNPVRAKLCASSGLALYPWTSVRWLLQPKLRSPWYEPAACLAHAGGLADKPAGRRGYLDYLVWLAEDEPTQKRLRFDRMAKGWAIGTAEFAQALMRENREQCGRSPRRIDEMRAEYEAHWHGELAALLLRMKRATADLRRCGKSEEWKIALGAALKSRTIVTNRWLASHLHLGDPFEVSRKISAWRRSPNLKLLHQLR